MDIAGERGLCDLLRERVRINGEATFCIFESSSGEVQSFSYAEFDLMASKVAGGFLELGIKHGDPVIVQLPNSVEFLLSWFGLAAIGAVMVPIHTGQTLREIEYVARKSRAVAAVTRLELVSVFQSAVAEQIAPQRIVVVGAEGGKHTCFESVRSALPHFTEGSVKSDDLLQIVFTSGTTAEPKGVLLTHANAIRSGEQIARSLYLTPDDRALTSLPLFHVNAQSSTLLAALSVGASCVFLEQYSASRFIDQLVAHKATVTSLVATLVRTLLLQPAKPSDCVHGVTRVFYAINVTDSERDEFERRFGMRLLNGYGLSEAYTAVTIAPLFGEGRWPSVGRPLVDREIMIADEHGKPVATGVIGEIAVRGVPGRQIFAGYLDDENATVAALRGDWLFTGDSGFLDNDGYMFFVDRKKDMIKRSGENVSAAEVERTLLEHPEVLEAAVIGVPDSIRDEAILAFVVLGKNSSSTPDSLIDHCRNHLSSFKVPSAIVIRDDLPKTSIGKIEKKVLRQDPVAVGSQP
jgi:crotonobetaine/carnitine-CoA ligase